MTATTLNGRQVDIGYILWSVLVVAGACGLIYLACALAVRNPIHTLGWFRLSLFAVPFIGLSFLYLLGSGRIWKS